MTTALVTGASQGIGAAFARRLAARGHDLVLVARNADAMHALAGELESGGRSVEVLPADLTDTAQLAQVEARLADDSSSAVDLLVNNAGFGTTGTFHDLGVDRLTDEITLNVTALMRLSHAALPGMVARKGGGIINISSIAGFQPTPRTSTYGATKAFVTSFSIALHAEYRSQGVNVLCVAPGATRTEWQERAGFDESSIPSFAWQTADEVAAGSLRAFDSKRALFTSGLPNKVLAAGTHLAPRSLVARIAGAFTG